MLDGTACAIPTAVQELERNADHLDESLLATANAWMRKAAEDKLDGQFRHSLLISTS